MKVNGSAINFFKYLVLFADFVKVSAKEHSLTVNCVFQIEKSTLWRFAKCKLLF